MDLGAFSWIVVDLFDTSALRQFWIANGVTDRHWKDWRVSGKRGPILPEYPSLSDLAYVDEDSIRFELATLAEECTRALDVVSDPEVIRLLMGLRTAAALASQQGGAVYVYPAASGEQVGDVRTSRSSRNWQR